MKCSKCKKDYIVTQKCSHEAVNRKYGESVCHSCCRKCSYSQIVGTGRRCGLPNAELKVTVDLKSLDIYRKNIAREFI